jgi:hypothetical protein
MDAGLLFDLARRTSACQRVIGRAAALFQVEISEVRVCARDAGLNGSLAAVLKKRPMVFLVGTASGLRPDCAGAIFQALRVPVDRRGEPKGILRLSGGAQTGYLIESVNQAIILLPDDPYEILRMLPAVFGRLKRKFGLSGEFPKTGHPDYEKLITACMEKQKDAKGEGSSL